MIRPERPDHGFLCGEGRRVYTPVAREIMNEHIADNERFDTYELVRKALRELQSCTHCGAVSTKEHRSRTCWGVALRGWQGAAIFCGPRCLAMHFDEHPEFPAARIEHAVLFPPEERGYWTRNGCVFCGREDEKARYYQVEVPSEFDSIWGSERGPCFCSVACLVAAFELDAEALGLSASDYWQYRGGLAIPNQPRERPHRVASLKRLRRKLRPQELARLGF
ncbi:MAG: hypothetical protein WC766_04290 [Patescibacteria group bacterium]